ncbi:MAG TPA: hypothetical protein VME46_04475, partial [Acidimicrobiales bacterium]|nr:hypothetical protein [Acidimicrobiales bacterium]
ASPGGATRTPGDALVSRARELVHAGRLAEARPVLDEAAQLHHQAGDAKGEVVCLRLGATISRLLGDLPGAAERAERSARLASPGSREAIAAASEQADIDAASGDFASAAARASDAVETAELSGWEGQPLADLLRQRARLLALDGQTDAALREMARITALFAGDRDGRQLWARVEQATALLGAGKRGAARDIVEEVRASAQPKGDHPLLAQLALLDVADRVGQGDIAAALRAAEVASEESLEAGSPLVYAAAALALATLADRVGDRLRAYATLASAMVTLGDKIGKPESRAIVEPVLIELRDRWGAKDFAGVKASYEDQRREALRRSS